MNYVNMNGGVNGVMLTCQECNRMPPWDRRQLPLLAALQPRPEPHRKGLRQTQGPDPKSRRQSYDELWRAIEQVCDLYSEQESANYFKACGYETK